jgi:hypothetical protein
MSVSFGQLRGLQIALCLIGLRDDFADVEGWDAGVRSFIQPLA